MSYLKLNDVLPEGAKRCCLAIGVFDGVHAGHRRILAELAACARRHAAAAVAVTFDPHPRFVLAPESAPPLLLPLAWRKRYLRAAGADAVAVVPFTRAFAALSPEEFLAALLDGNGGIPVAGVVVGAGWRFGCAGAGNADTLKKAAAARGFEFIAVDELCDGEKVSSTAIRHAAAGGDLARAAALLGRPYALYGVVEPGFQAAGGELRHPTANLSLTAGVLPPDGVYAGRALGLPAAVNIGVAPTYGDRNRYRRRVEVHILDFNENIYGRELEVELFRFLREERTFPGPAELRAQIERDIQRIRALAAADCGNEEGDARS